MLTRAVRVLYTLLTLWCLNVFAVAHEESAEAVDGLQSVGCTAVRRSVQSSHI
jgi:hypothetical protein